jgi:hypothetical protein
MELPYKKLIRQLLLSCHGTLFFVQGGKKSRIANVVGDLPYSA